MVDFGLWDWYDVFFMIVGVILTAGGVFLSLRDRTQPIAMALALFLIFNGMEGLMHGIASIQTSSSSWWLITKIQLVAAEAGWIGSYFLLLSYIPVGWNQWMANKKFRLSMFGVMVLYAIPTLALKQEWFTFTLGPDGIEAAPSAAAADAGFLFSLFDFFSLIAIIATWLGIVIAVNAFQTADPGLPKKRARAYMLGLVVLDAVLSFELLWNLGVGYYGLGRPDFLASTQWYAIRTPVLQLWAFSWITYGVLSARMFDIDLRIKYTITKGAVVGSFIGVYFLASEVVKELATENIGIGAGIGTMLVLAFFIKPLQKLADKLADKAMPNTPDVSATVNPDAQTNQYLEFRKLETFKETIKEVIADGLIGSAERRVLDTMAKQMGISPEVASMLEADIIGKSGITTTSEPEEPTAVASPPSDATSSAPDVQATTPPSTPADPAPPSAPAPTPTPAPEASAPTVPAEPQAAPEDPAPPKPEPPTPAVPPPTEPEPPAEPARPPTPEPAPAPTAPPDEPAPPPQLEQSEEERPEPSVPVATEPEKVAAPPAEPVSTPPATTPPSPAASEESSTPAAKSGTWLRATLESATMFKDALQSIDGIDKVVCEGDTVYAHVTGTIPAAMQMLAAMGATNIGVEPAGPPGQ